MTKLSRAKIKAHERVCQLIESDKLLGQDDVHEVITHWSPSYSGQISKGAAWFTPLPIAQTLVAMTTNVEGNILDLCAGIGSLLYAMKSSTWWRWEGVEQVWAIEVNPEYVRVGKRLFPEVNWICGDMFDLDTLRALPKIDSVVSNPPYGNVDTTSKPDWLNYKGVAHLAAVEIAMRLAERGAGFILPQGDLPFRYTGVPYHKYLPSDKWSDELSKFYRANPTIHMESTAVDTSLYEWADAPVVEIVNTEFDPWDAEMLLPLESKQLQLF